MKKRLCIYTILLFISAGMAQAQDTLKHTKKQVADDIAFLFKNAAQIHPNLYHNISPKQLSKRTDSLINKLPDSLSTLMVYRAFAEVTSFINEGHTGISIPLQIKKQMRAGTFRSIPLQVTAYHDNYFQGNLILSPTKLQAIKVSAINGQSAQSIIKKILALKGGLTSFRQVVVINNFRFFLSVINMVQPYVIQYVDSNNIRKTITVNSISESEYFAALTKPVNDKPYTFTVFNKANGYFNFKSMANYEVFTKFCDSVFTALDSQQVKKLVIDLRENSGGNSALGKYLLDYLTDVPYRMAGQSERKVSQQFKDQVNGNKNLYGNDYDDYLKMQNDSFLRMGMDDLNKSQHKKHKFTGRVCFLIGPYTFSSANMLAATIKDFKLFTLIGEPTGEPANDYGEICNINLPQTGLMAFTSTTLWVRPNNNRTDNNPIMPDYAVKGNGTTGDNVLQFAVEWLAK